MKRSVTITAGLILSFASAASRADEPLRGSYAMKSTGMANTAQLILSPQYHPEVAVDRALAAQPVHPWMAEVVLGGTPAFAHDHHSFGAGNIITTFIDPLQRLDGNYGLDSNHSLVQAQRLWLTFNGVDSNMLAEMSNAALAAQPRANAGNQAKLVALPSAPARAPHSAAPMRIFIPSAPKSTDSKIWMASSR